MRLRETPVPIPNTMVKPQAAENTILETVWEDRWVPGSFKKKQQSGCEADFRMVWETTVSAGRKSRLAGSGAERTDES